MPVTIEPIPERASLRVTGDIETVLTVPYDDDDRFLVGLSDGTLLLGTYNERLQCVWQVAKEGAGTVRFIGDSVMVDWLAEWVTVSVYDANIIEPQLPQTLPLFPDLDRYAA